MIPFVNNLLEQPLQNKTSKNEIMHDQVGQNEFETSDEDKIIQEDDLDYSTVRDGSRSSGERNTGERQGEQSNSENETTTRRRTKPIRE